MKLRTKRTQVAATLLLSFAAMSVQAEEQKEPLSISGFIDMSYYSTNTDGGESTKSSGLDQAFIAYAYTDNISVKAGRLLSYSDFESEEPTDLYHTH